MKLTQVQLEAFDRDGYLFFPSLFRPEEIKVLQDEVPALYAQRRPENVREKTGDVVRTAFAVHTYNRVFEALIHHPHFVEPAEQLLGDRTYIHQFKLNGKAAFDGDVWQWHQDYGTWKADDDMPEARAMNLAVFLDEVNEFNGPLWFIPESHKKGAIEAKHDLTTTSYPLWVIDNDSIAQLVKQGGIVAPKGGPGSAIFFHSTLVHGSPPNLSPWDRQIVYVTYNAVTNAIRRFKRPEYIAHRDFTPIDAWPEDCVLSAATRRAAE
jgi:ectoine hydroxylase